MQREIKFRAWDKSINQMCDVGEIHFCHGGLMALGTGVHLGNDWVSRKDDLPCDVVLMQYTGLHDKNGIAVYEDDIIILEPDDSKEYGNEPHSLDYGDICTVEWSNTNLAYYLMPVDENKEEQQMDYFGAWSGWSWIKVIGNIHQHPDLIRKD